MDSTTHNLGDSADQIHANVMGAHGATFGVGGKPPVAGGQKPTYAGKGGHLTTRQEFGGVSPIGPHTEEDYKRNVAAASPTNEAGYEEQRAITGTPDIGAVSPSASGGADLTGGANAAFASRYGNKSASDNMANRNKQIKP